MSRLKLKRKKLKLKKNETETSTIYLSNNLLTDNDTFIIIDLPLIEKFRFNYTGEIDHINITPEDMEFFIDKETEITVSKGLLWVTFINYGQVKREMYNLIIDAFPDCVFHPITLWFKRPVNTLIGVVSKPQGPPVCVLKAKELNK